MRILAALGTASLIAAVTLPARAQDPASGTPPTESASASDAGVDDTPIATAAWSRGLDALVRGDLELAAGAFGEVAAQSTNDTRRATARDLIDRIGRRKAAGAPRSIAPHGPSPVVDAPEAPAPDGGNPGPNHEGRLTTLGVTTLLGLAAYGWTVPMIMDLDGRPAVGMYMLVAGASFGVPYLATRSRTVTWPMAGLGFWGGTRGIAHGAMVAALIAPSSTSDRGLAASILVGSTTELVAGLAWGAYGDMTPGAAHTIGLAGDVGLLVGLGLGHVTGLDQYHRPDGERDRDAGMRTLMGMGLAGTVVGVAGGTWWSGRRDRSFGDIEVTRAAGVVGAWAAASVAIVAGADDSRVDVGSALLGGIAGLVAGDYLVRDANFGFAQSVFVDLGTLAGGLAGAGVAYLVTSDTDSVKPYFVASAIGAAGGFGLLTLTQLDTARARRGARASQSEPVPRLALMPTFGRDGHRGLALGGAF